MKSWSLRVGKFFGIDVYIHWSFWIIIGWVFLSRLGDEQPFSQGLQGALFILAIFVCVVLHEFGHALTARYFGIATRDITLYPIGGVSSLEKMPENPRQELLVAVSGPAVNLVIALLLWISLTAAGQTFDPASIGEANDITRIPFLWGLFYANLVLPIFNLIPAFPMDGGRALRSILSFFMNRVSATLAAAQIGQLLAVAFVLLGLFYNFWLIFIGLFVFLGAGAEAVHEQTKAAVAGLRVKDALMHKITVFAPGTTLGTVSEALLNSQETAFVVADTGKPVGILGINEIIKGLTEKGKEAPVSEYMNTDFRTVSSEMSLQDFLEQVLDKGQTIAVVEDGASILGLIDQQNFQERMMIQQALLLPKL